MDLNIPTSGSSPDFVVYEPKNGQVTLVEIKGSERNRDLPLATIPAMRNLIEAYKDLHPRVVLVTGSGIPSNLMKQLSDENIIVIQFVDEESAISELITVLEGKEQGER
jgi:predicted Fe-Mo cluster-binding NifX family protein